MCLSAQSRLQNSMCRSARSGLRKRPYGRKDSRAQSITQPRHLGRLRRPDGNRIGIGLAEFLAFQPHHYHRLASSPCHDHGRSTTASTTQQWLQGVTLRTEYLSERLTPYPLPTKDGGVLRTVGDAHAYMQALPKTRALRVHWQHASRLLLDEVRPAALTCQVQVALFMDGTLDDGAFRHLSSARRWRRHAVAS
jgi:hypothetical protein